MVFQTIRRSSKKYIAFLSLTTVCLLMIYTSNTLLTTCCNKMNKDCLACRNGTSVDDFCFEYPGQFGCGHRIMLAMVVSDKRGYVKFSADVIRKYNKVNPRDILIYDDSSIDLNSYTLHKWFGDINDTHAHKHMGEDTVFSQILINFVHSKYDVLFIINPNIILHKNYINFINDHIMKYDGLLWLFNPENLPKICEDGLCEVQSCQQSEIAITKPVAEMLLKNQETFGLGNFEQILHQNGIRILIPEMSLVMHFGLEGNKTSCSQKDMPHKLSLCSFPQWIQDGYEFYQEKCHNAEEFYVQSDSLPRSTRTEHFYVAVIIIGQSMKAIEACLKSIVATGDSKHNYNIYIALDSAIDSFPNRKQLEKYSINNYFIATIPVNYDSNFINIIFSKAYSDENDYFVFTKDTVIFQSKLWVSKAIKTLRNNLPINIGVIKPTCEKCDPSTMPAIMSRLHYDIFKSLYPIQLPSSQVNTWLEKVYGPQHLMILEDWIIEIQDHGKMTLTEKDHENGIDDQVQVDGKKFKNWLKPVVSFSLYGSNPRYTGGATANMKLMSKFFPEWQMWVYHDNTVPDNILKQLCDYNVTLIDMTNFQIRNQMSWRFLVASEPVTRFIVRDIDSRLSKRDKAAVDEWVNSDKKFHVLRDHPNHAAWAINGGMWGATGDAIPNLKSLLLSYNPSGKYIQDMNFLSYVVWEYAKHSVMQHDEISNGKFGETRPFPVKPEGHEFVGDVYINGEQV